MWCIVSTAMVRNCIPSEWNYKVNICAPKLENVKASEKEKDATKIEWTWKVCYGKWCEQ